MKKFKKLCEGVNQELENEKKEKELSEEIYNQYLSLGWRDSYTTSTHRLIKNFLFDQFRLRFQNDWGKQVIWLDCTSLYKEYIETYKVPIKSTSTKEQIIEEIETWIKLTMESLIPIMEVQLKTEREEMNKNRNRETRFNVKKIQDTIDSYKKYMNQ